MDTSVAIQLAREFGPFVAFIMLIWHTLVKPTRERSAEFRDSIVGLRADVQGNHSQLDHVREALTRGDRKFDSLEKKVDQVNERSHDIDKRVVRIEAKVLNGDSKR